MATFLADTFAPARVLIVCGMPGNGVQAFISRRTPALADSTAATMLTGQWPPIAPSLCLAPSTAAVPTTPPPSTYHSTTFVLGCATPAELPAWVHALPEDERVIVTLGVYSLSEMCAALDSALGKRIAVGAATAIGELSGRVPAAVAEVTRTLTTQGALQLVDGVWSFVAPIDPAWFLPAHNLRMAQLTAPQRRAFTEISLAEPTQVTSFSRAASAQLRALTEFGLVEVTTQGAYRCRIPVMGTLARLTADPAQKTEVYTSLLDTRCPPVHVLEWALAEDQPVAAEQIIHTVQDLLKQHAWAQGVQVAEQALQLRGDLFNKQQVTELNLARATGLRFDDAAEEAVIVLDEMISDAQEETQEPSNTVITATLMQADIAHYKFGHPHKAIQLCSELEAITRSRTDLAAVTAHLLTHLAYAGKRREFNKRFATTPSRLRMLQGPVRARLRIAEIFMLIAGGKPRKALRMVTLAGARQRLHLAPDPWVTEELSAAFFVAQMRSDGPAKLPSMIRYFETRGGNEYRPDHSTYGLASAGWEFARGSISHAHSSARAALTATEIHDPSGLAQSIAAICAETAALLGNPVEAEEFLMIAQQLPPRSSAVIAGGVAAHCASTEYLLGRSSASRSTIAEGHNFEADEAYGFAAELYYAGIRHGDIASAQALLAIGDQLEGRLFGHYLRHAQAIVAQDPVMLCDHAARLEDSGLALYALEAYTLAQRLPGIPQTVTRRCGHAASRLAAFLELTRHPFLPRHLTNTVTLTAREQEIQGLIVEGLTNQEIATRLQLSPRTVEGHITRLYQKTGEKRRPQGRKHQT